MKKINQLRLYQRGAALLLAFLMPFTLTGCKSGKADLTSISINELMENDDVKDATLIDELVESGHLNYTTAEGQMDLITSAGQLEKYMDISDKLSSMDFAGVEDLLPLAEEEYQEALSLSDDEIDRLIEASKYEGKSLVQLEQKLVALKKLNYLYSYTTNWAKSNGRDISTRLMMASVKASLADELDLSVEDYGNITIPAATRSLSEGPASYYIKVGEESYEVPTRSEEIWNTIDYIYDLQSAKSIKEPFKTYRKAINFSKTTIAAGSNLKNKKLEPQYDASYLEKNYVK